MFKLLRYFSFTSLIAFIAMTVILAVFYRQTAIEDLIQVKEDNSKMFTWVFAKSIWSEFDEFMQFAPQLTEDELSTHSETARLRQLVNEQMIGLSAISARVHSLDGVTIFSTNLDDIGATDNVNAAFLSARDGATASELYFDNGLQGRDVVVSYMPIQPDGPGTAIEGVFELHDDVTTFVDQIERTQRNIILGVVGILSALYIVLYLIVRHGDRIIRQERSVRQMAENALKKAHNELEQKVAQRTLELSQTNIKLQDQITKREEAEAVRLKVEQERLELEKQQALAGLKEGFMVAISHEFRTPLSVVGLSSELLERYWDRYPAERRNQHLSAIRAQVKHLDTMLDEIFLVMRAQTGQLEFAPEPVNVVEMAESLMNVLGASLGREHKLSLCVAQPPAVFHADPKLLRFILSNLMSNAIKYSPKGSEICLYISEEQDNLVFKVEDHGVGISLQDQAQLFDPYFRGGNVSGVSGTGLGLKIVKDFVELHGGAVAVESEVGVGSTFIVRLPLLVAEMGAWDSNNDVIMIGEEENL